MLSLSCPRILHCWMLKLFIDEILKEEDLKAEILPWDLGSYKGQRVDIIVAPTDMGPHLKSATSRVVLIQNLVDKEEIRAKVVAAIREFLDSSAAG